MANKRTGRKKPAKNNIKVTVGVFAHNEEKNLSLALESLLNQTLDRCVISSIIIVSSGSTDKTNSIAKKFTQIDSRIQTIFEDERNGKSHAINLFLAKSNTSVVVTMSADLVLDNFAIERLCKHFSNPAVGMVGAHPIPQAIDTSTIQKEIDLLWELHHRISLIRPKCGELVGFRNIIRQIPRDSAVDEATIEVLLQLVGYIILYEPDSIVYNKGPKDFSEFLLQRRRVYIGHQWVQKKYQYRVVTMKTSTLIRIVLIKVLEDPDTLASMWKLVLMELYARVLAWLDFTLLRRNPYRWKMVAR